MGEPGVQQEIKLLDPSACARPLGRRTREGRSRGPRLLSAILFDMIRFVPGPSWKLNPGYVSALRNLRSGEAAALGESPGILDALHIEVDGVAIGRNLGEGDLFAEVDELVAVALRLCREPAGGGQIGLAGGKAELVLGRRGTRACLSLVSLGRPACLLSSEVEVELPALAQAAAACAEAVCRDLRAVNPLLAAAPLHRRLARGAQALRKAASLASPPSAPPPAPSPLMAERSGEVLPGPAVRLALDDPHGRIETYRGGADLFALLAPGELSLVGLGGGGPVRVPGPPFLALTELSRAAGAILSAAQAGDPALDVPLPGPAGKLRVQLRESPGFEGPPPLALARAFLQAALDFAGALCARNPAFRDNPYLSSLGDGAREKLEALRELEAGDLFAEPLASSLSRSRPRPAAPPLSPRGNLRRLRFGLAWRTALPGGPVLALAAFPRSVAALGDDSVAFLDARTGALVAARAGQPALAPPGVLLVCGGRVAGISEAGETLWMRDLAGRSPARAIEGCGECLAGPRGSTAALMAAGNRLSATLALTGRTAWQIEPPHVLKLRAAAQGDRVFAAADTGVLYGLDARTGEVAFRVRPGVSAEGPLCALGSALAFVGRGSDGALWLVGLDARTGQTQFKAALPLDEAPELMPFARKWVAVGARGDAPVVLGFGRSGRLAFDLELDTQGGAPAAARQGKALFLSLRDGSIHAVAPSGARLWSLGSAGAELAHPLRPLVRRDVLLAPADRIRALSPETGSVLSELPQTPGLVGLAAGPGLEVFTADDMGVVTCLRLATHLSVVA